MPNSRSGVVSRRHRGGLRSGHITMIEAGVLYHAIRRAKIAFWTVGGIVAVITTVIGAGFTHPVKAAGIGILAGALTGVLAGLILFCWPAARIAWHWAAELSLLTLFLAAYLAFTQVMAPPAALGLLALIVGGPLIVPPIRRRIKAWLWCAVSRHRLRLCFAAFIAAQRTGWTPLILFARPIPAGERVWIWLRPGLALADVEGRLDRLAAGCWAAECRIAPASRRYAALCVIDIARRNPLHTAVGSPLPAQVPASRGANTPTPTVSGGLDLPDVPDTTDAPVPVAGKRRPRAVAATPATSEPAAADLVTTAGPVDDLSDWI